MRMHIYYSLLQIHSSFLALVTLHLVSSLKPPPPSACLHWIQMFLRYRWREREKERESLSQRERD